MKHKLACSAEAPPVRHGAAVEATLARQTDAAWFTARTFLPDNPGLDALVTTVYKSRTRH
jgi:hypothetical protein